MNFKLFKVTLCAILSALGTIAFTIEGLFPPLFLPGARLGVSNIFILLAAIILGGKYAFITLMVKTVLGSLFAGNLSMILYSLPAGAIALTVELIIIYIIRKTSVVAVSVGGVGIPCLFTLFGVDKRSFRIIRGFCGISNIKIFAEKIFC